MKVTTKWLKDNNACNHGIFLFNSTFKNSAELKDIIEYGSKAKDKTQLQYCNWLIVRKMDRKQKIKYAVFAEEQVLYIMSRLRNPNCPQVKHKTLTGYFNLSTVHLRCVTSSV